MSSPEEKIGMVKYPTNCSPADRAILRIDGTLERLVTAVNELRSVVASVGEQIANSMEEQS